jgi:hypothetical protein
MKKFHILTAVLLLSLIFSFCSKKVLKHDFQNLKIFAGTGCKLNTKKLPIIEVITENKKYLSDSTQIHLLVEHNRREKGKYIDVILDLNEIKSIDFIKNINEDLIEAYIVIKDTKGNTLAQKKIVTKLEKDIVENSDIFDSDTGKLISMKVDEEDSTCYVIDPESGYLPQIVNLRDNLSADDEKKEYSLYIIGNYTLKKRKDKWVNIATSPKFLKLRFDKWITFDPIFNEYKFFVEAYYRPSTPDNIDYLEFNIDWLVQDVEMEKKGNIITEAKSQSKYIKKAFENLYDSVQQSLVEIIKSRDNVLVVVEGYTDERPIHKLYNESEVAKFESNDHTFPLEGEKFPSFTISKGDSVNSNEILSQLRAYYTMKHIDQMFETSIQYRKLKENNRIIFKIAGRGVYQTHEDEYPIARKVNVLVRPWIRE